MSEEFVAEPELPGPANSALRAALESLDEAQPDEEESAASPQKRKAPEPAPPPPPPLRLYKITFIKLITLLSFIKSDAAATGLYKAIPADEDAHFPYGRYVRSVKSNFT